VDWRSLEAKRGMLEELAQMARAELRGEGHGAAAVRARRPAR